MPLLDPQTLRYLARLEVLARRVARGTTGGERLSAALGRSLDFAQHRQYFAGDDLRLIDWNVYARQGRYVVKQFEAETDLQLYLLVDHSTSMDFGEPSKIHRARQLAAGLGYVTLTGLDRVHVYGIANRLGAGLPGLRGRSQFGTLCRFLEHMPIGGHTDLFAAVREFCAGEPLPGLVVLLSDCWDFRRFHDTIRLLRFHHHDVVVLQIVTPEELDSPLTGDLQIIDSETGATRDVTATPRVLAEYARGVQRATQAMRRFVVRHGGRFFQVTTDMPVDEVVRDVLRTGGVLGRI